jgi:hypothetical protein
MEFKPRTEQEIQDARLWEKGSYDFEIVEAEEKLSKSSNKPMIEMRVKVTNKEGVRLAQYITTGKDNERAELWQLRGFSAANIMDAFRDIHVMAGATKCEKADTPFS